MAAKRTQLINCIEENLVFKSDKKPSGFLKRLKNVPKKEDSVF